MPRTYQPRSIGAGGMMQIPSGPNVLQDLSNVMAWGQRLEQYQQQQADRQRQEQDRARVDGIRKAINDHKGDLDAAAGALEQGGDYVSAKELREQQGQIREQMFGAVTERIGQQKSVMGKASQLLAEVQRDPSLYDRVRPQLVEMATAVDPRLASEIPERYEPERVAGMAKFVAEGDQQATIRARAAAEWQALQTRQTDSLKRAAEEKKILDESLSTVKTLEEWDGTIATWRMLGMTPAVLDKAGEWSEDAPERARQRLLTPLQRGPKEPEKADNPEEAFFQAVEKGDMAAAKRLLSTRRQWAEAGRDPKASNADDTDLTPRELERMRLNDLREVQKRIGQADAIGNVFTQAMADERTAAINAFYRGLKTPGATPPKPAHPSGVRGEEFVPPQHQPRPGAGMSPIRPVPSSRREAVSAVPEPVGSVLKGQKPGRYTLTDGSRWIVNPDQTITPAPR